MGRIMVIRLGRLPRTAYAASMADSSDESPREPGPPRYPGANMLVLTVAVYGLFLFSARTLADGDTFWHITAGDWMLAHFRVPRHDPFAFATAGLTWVPHEWLAEILFALAYRAAGWSGVVILAGAAGALAFALMARALERWVPSLPSYGLLMLTLLTLAPTMLARPHVLALPVMVAWTVILVRARERDATPALPAAALMALWANLHGGFMGGLVLAGALAAEAVLWAGPARWRVARRWAGFLALAVLAAMLTPHGPAGLLFPLRMMALDNKRGIQEWQAPNFQNFEPLELILLGALFLGLTGSVRLPWYRVLIFLGLLHSALVHTRFQLQLAMVGFLILAPALGPALQFGLRQPRQRNMRVELAMLLALLAALTTARLIEPRQQAETDTTPFSALARVPAELRRLPVLNEYHLGGFLIFHGIAPYIDSRADLYGDAFLDNYIAIAQLREPAIRAALARHDIAWSIVGATSPLAGWLDAQPDWQRLHADRHVVIHIRERPDQ